MAKDRKIELLKDVPLFWGCSDKELKAVARITDEIQKPAGAVLMKEGDAGRELYVIAKGSAKISKGGRKIRMAGPGEAIGELALIDGGVRSATVTAESELVAYVVGQRSFTALLQDAPSVGLKLLRALAKRVREAERSILH